MLRPIPSFLALCAAMLTAAPALAADYSATAPNDDSLSFRDGYPTEPGDWAGLGDKDDGMSFEFGTRYWYSMGAMSVTSGFGTGSESDTAHIGELHLRIEDHTTNTWATLLGGLAFKVDGTSSGTLLTSTIADGQIGYFGADIGWNALGDGKGSGLGPLVGYLYMRNAPDTGRVNYTTAESAADITYDPTTGQTFIPGASAANSVDLNMLRLGVAGKAQLGDLIDISGNVAAVPYATISGTVGVDDPTFSTTVYSGPAQLPYTGVASGNISSMRASATQINGWGYGAQAEAFVGIHPTQNFTVRLGGRAQYLTGTVDATYDRAVIGDPSDSDGANPPNFDTAPSFNKTSLIETNNKFSMFRYGLLAELSYNF